MRILRAAREGLKNLLKQRDCGGGVAWSAQSGSGGSANKVLTFANSGLFVAALQKTKKAIKC